MEKTIDIKKSPDQEGFSDSPTAIVAHQENTFNVQALISQAIDKNVPVETMEKLLAMAQVMKAEWAKEEFNKAMAKFQAECPTIKKTKEVKTNTGASAYHYAPLESIVEQVKAPLSDNGFSYSTDVEVLDAGVKSTIKVTHIAGHSEQSTMEVPLGNKTNIMSASQVTAAASTFAKRYAFCNAFGILTGDEDNDAQTPKETKPQAAQATKPSYKYAEQSAYQEFAEYIRNAKDEKELKAIGDAIKDQKFSTSETAALRGAYKSKLSMFAPIVVAERDFLKEMDQEREMQEIGDSVK